MLPHKCQPAPARVQVEGNRPGGVLLRDGAHSGGAIERKDAQGVEQRALARGGFVAPREQPHGSGPNGELVQPCIGRIGRGAGGVDPPTEERRR